MPKLRRAERKGSAGIKYVDINVEMATLKTYWLPDIPEEHKVDPIMV